MRTKPIYDSYLVNCIMLTHGDGHGMNGVHNKENTMRGLMFSGIRLAENSIPFLKEDIIVK